MQILYGDTELAAGLEGRDLAIATSRVPDTYVATGAEAAAIATAPLQPCAASFRAVRRSPTQGEALVQLFAAAALPHQSNLALGEETMPGAVLASASSRLSGLAVTTLYQFQGGQIG